MKKNGSSSKGRKSGSGFAGVRRRRFWKKYGGVVITVSAILVLAVVGIWAISATNKNTAERMSSQLATVQPTPTPTEVVVLDGITIAKAETETEEATEATPEATEEAEEEGEEEVAKAEESEEATEATPSATAQPTQAQQQQATVQPTQAQQQQATAQPTQAQQVVTTTATSGNSWSWSYHNDNGQVTVSTSGEWPEGVDPNDPNSVYQWMLQNTGINPYFFQ